MSGGARVMALAALGLSGCTLLFGEVDKTECRVDIDCPELEICVDRSYCTPGVRDASTERPDRGPGELDDGVRDVMPDGPPPDMIPDATPDVMPDALLDMRPDADPEAIVFADGDCFEGAASGTYDPRDPPVGDLHVPQPGCTPFARVWTARAEGGVELAWDLDRDDRAEGRVPLGGGYAIGPGVVFATGRRDGDGRRLVQRVELRSGASSPVRQGSFDQRDPVYGGGRLAFVETAGDRPPGVVIVDGVVDGEPAEWDCARAGTAQWGPAVGARYTAWFEQPVGSRRTRVVVLDGPICDGSTGRRVEVLDAEVPPDARLWAVDGGLAWLEPRVDGLGNRIRWWRFDAPAADVQSLYIDGPRVRVDPERPPEGPNPIELTGFAHRLAVVRYDPDGARRYVLDVLDVDDPREPTVTRAAQDNDARAPWLSASYLLWAEADRLGMWRVAYERLR